MKIVTWNVNSIRSRIQRVVDWLEKFSPDVLCVQELKCQTDDFPYEPIEQAGYHCAVHGQKTYNGVAIISKAPLENVVKGFGDVYEDKHSRLISGRVGDVDIINGYFPNGGSVGSDAWDYKIQWMGKLVDFLDSNFNPVGKLVLCGDFNVAVDDLDIAHPDQWIDTVLTHEDVRIALKKIKQWGFEDVFRQHNPDGKVYSWWDYRRLAFPKNAGLRIDHIYMTPSLATTCTAASVDRNERKKRGDLKPSDHAPVLAVVK